MKGILFKPEMNLAIREDRKTVTRRTDHLKEINLADTWEISKYNGEYTRSCDGGFQFMKKVLIRGERNLIAVKPRYHIGETVYVKEAWADMVCVASTEKGKGKGESRPIYKISANPTELKILQGYWKSPLFLPEKYARTFLQITDVRPERLQEITDEDAQKEGISDAKANDMSAFRSYCFDYQLLWDSINPDMPFSKNPWVWRIEFKKAAK